MATISLCDETIRRLVVQELCEMRLITQVQIDEFVDRDDLQDFEREDFASWKEQIEALDVILSLYS
jgi:hypothetical protein